MLDVAQSISTADVVKRFGEAFNRHDIPAVMDLMTEDCTFENTYPPPDGGRFQGQEAVRRFWEEFFDSTPSADFQTEDLFISDDRCLLQWKYSWTNADGSRGHVRGVDVLRVRDGKIAEKFAYVKG